MSGMRKSKRKTRDPRVFVDGAGIEWRPAKPDQNSERTQKIRNEHLTINEDYDTRLRKVLARMAKCYDKETKA